VEDGSGMKGSLEQNLGKLDVMEANFGKVRCDRISRLYSESCGLLAEGAGTCVIILIRVKFLPLQFGTLDFEVSIIGLRLGFDF